MLAGLLTYFLGSVKASQLDHRTIACTEKPISLNKNHRMNAKIYLVKASQLDHRCWPSHYLYVRQLPIHNLAGVLTKNLYRLAHLPLLWIFTAWVGTLSLDTCSLNLVIDWTGFLGLAGHSSAAIEGRMSRFGRVEPEPRALIHYCRQDPSAHKAWISPSLRKPSWDKPSLGSLKRIQTNVKKLEAK